MDHMATCMCMGNRSSKNSETLHPPFCHVIYVLDAANKPRPRVRIIHVGLSRDGSYWYISIIQAAIVSDLMGSSQQKPQERRNVQAYVTRQRRKTPATEKHSRCQFPSGLCSAWRWPVAAAAAVPCLACKDTHNLLQGRMHG